MMKKMILAVLALVIFATSCSSDDDNSSPTNSNLILNLDGLEALGNDFVYEGWIIVDGSPVSTGTFSSVDFPQTFSVNTTQLNDATTFVLSIEPAVDTDPAPAATKILAGDFSGTSATVNSNGIVGNFSAASGTYILATPTDADDTNEDSGVWFLDNTSGTPMTGLNLPTLTDGWKYEGWAVLNGTPISTGTFIDPASADENASTSIFKGDAGNGPEYPGEDYLQNAPAGMTFPTDLRGATIVISVEPSPDNSPMPFTLKPLAHEVPGNAMVHTAISMGTGPVATISGSVTRN
ncbi:anti-sigma factor [Winogradskyella schleiferi]|uniref:anti-sigma factor n=1 Tax=Winogradskyella schleiferi TaxID=2686078 RepID=UPI0015B8046C|nr:anti-sigma factor [Winogradskyella schleiferi]